MKNIIESLEKDNTYLENLSNKLDDFSFYKDVDFSMRNIPKEWTNIADKFISIIKDGLFTPEDNDELHYFIPLDDCGKSIGFKHFTVCPYKGYETTDNIVSNFMFDCFDGAHLTVDIYNVYNISEEEIKKAIIQELFNFKRDAEFSILGNSDELSHLIDDFDLDFLDNIED